MSFEEIGVRGRQETAKLSERLLGHDRSEMSDRAFLSRITPESRRETAEATAGRILETIRERLTRPGDTFFPSSTTQPEIASIIERRYPLDGRQLIDRAERALDGLFDLLGLPDLAFGKTVDWRLEPLSGKRTPLDHWSKIDYLDPAVGGDKKITWELNRHGHFVTLGQAYLLTGDERFARAFVDQASSWMDQNPPKLGINWASSLELAFRSISWLWALHLFAFSQSLAPSFLLRFFKHLIAHGRHVESYLSYYFSPNTHLTGEALGLVYIGAALPELKSAIYWRETGLRILIDQLDRQVRSDGVYFEQSSYYHRYTADFYSHLVVLARAYQIPLPAVVEEKLAQLMDHLMWITKPDGTSSIFADDDGGRLLALGRRDASDFRDTLAIGAGLLGRRNWKHVAGEPPVELLWLLGPDGLNSYDNLKPEPPAQASRFFGESGYMVMRDGWSPRSSYVLVDCGPHGAEGCGHAHSDALSFEFVSGGVSWLVDPGAFTYTGDRQLRDWFRGTEAHNTATVDDQPQSVPAGPFSWDHVARSTARRVILEAEFDYFEGSHDGYERLADPVTHRRSMLFVKQGSNALPSYLVLRDEFYAADRHAYAIRYHFSPGVSAAIRDHSIDAQVSAGKKLELHVGTSSSARMRIEEGWVSRAYAQRESAPVAVVQAEGTGYQEALSLLIPRDDQRYRVETRPQSALIIGEEGSFDVILTGDGSSVREADRLSSSGRLAFGRFTAAKPTLLLLIDGAMIEARGRVAFRSPACADYSLIKLDDNEIELKLEGPGEFDLFISEPVRAVTINYSRVEVSGDARQLRFVCADGLWRAW